MSESLINSSSISQLKKTEPHYLEKLEVQLKELWAQYIHCLDKYGLNETTTSKRACICKYEFKSVQRLI